MFCSMGRFVVVAGVMSVAGYAYLTPAALEASDAQQIVGAQGGQKNDRCNAGGTCSSLGSSVTPAVICTAGTYVKCQEYHNDVAGCGQDNTNPCGANHPAPCDGANGGTSDTPC